MKHSTTPCQYPWIGRFMLAAIIAPAIAASILALLPNSALHHWAEQIGHPDDISPERIIRLRTVASSIATAHLILFVLLATTGRMTIDRFLTVLFAEVSTAGVATAARQFWQWLNHSSRIHWTMLAIVLVVAGVIRLEYLQVPMDYDEAYSFLNYARRPLYQALADYNSTNNHLLNTLCMHVGFKSFGPWEWSLRIHALIAGLGAVGTIYILGRYCAGADAGLVASAIAATSYVMINYSINARGYIWTIWMTALLLVAFWRIGQSRPSLAVDWLGAGFAAVLGMFAVPTMLYSIAGCVAWLVLHSTGLREEGKDMRRHLLIWLLLVGLAVFWLYAPALVYQGISAWQHPFVRPQPIADWFGRSPLAWLFAVESWSDGPLPWFVMAGLGGIGLAWLAVLNRNAFSLLASIPSATLVVMWLQRVAPPPRIMSFLAPVFCVIAAAGIISIVKLVAMSETSRDATKSARTVTSLCSWMACGICIWGLLAVRDQPLPGGLRPAHLIEDVAQEWSRESLSDSRRPTQLWRLDVKEAVEAIHFEAKTNDRVLVGLPADLPFRFYAERAGWKGNIGGSSSAEERLFLVIRAGERPDQSLRENLTLQADRHDSSRVWERLAAGELCIWLANPVVSQTTESTGP